MDRASVLAREENVFRQISEGFNRYSEEPGTGAIVTLALLVAAALVVVRFLRPFLAERAEREKLWRALVQTHGLTRPEEEALRRFARGARLAEPAEVFVRKSLFDQVLQTGPRRDAGRLSDLRTKLF